MREFVGFSNLQEKNNGYVILSYYMITRDGTAKSEQEKESEKNNQSMETQEIQELYSLAVSPIYLFKIYFTFIWPVIQQICTHSRFSLPHTFNSNAPLESSSTAHTNRGTFFQRVVCQCRWTL